MRMAFGKTHFLLGIWTGSKLKSSFGAATVPGTKVALPSGSSRLAISSCLWYRPLNDLLIEILPSSR